MNDKTLLGLTLFVLAFLLLAGCSGEPRPLEVELAARDIEWSLSEIDAKVGQEVQLTITNEGVLEHDFTIDELGIDLELAPGETRTVTFTVDESGDVKYYCAIPGHVDAGMVGVIHVSE